MTNRGILGLTMILLSCQSRLTFIFLSLLSVVLRRLDLDPDETSVTEYYL